MTWNSEADFIKDIASLDDFGVTGNSYKIQYSFGRGTKLSQKPKISNEFIDPRSGEPISIDELDLGFSDEPPKPRGRGHLLRHYSKTKSQLQKQLRLARPLGSSDQIIESYCRRLIPKAANSESLTNPKPAPVEPETPAQESVPVTEKAPPRIKATRNSKLQTNALIAGLLNKNPNKTNEIIDDKKNGSSLQGECSDSEKGFPSTCTSFFADRNGRKALRNSQNLEVPYESSETEESEYLFQSDLSVGSSGMSDTDDIFLNLGQEAQRQAKTRGVWSNYGMYDLAPLSFSLTSEETSCNYESESSYSFKFNSKDFPLLK